MKLKVSHLTRCVFEVLFIAKFRLKLKKGGKTIKPFRYDLNPILYDYTVKGTSRFKGLDLIDWLKSYHFEASWHCTGGSDQDHLPKKETQKDKIVVRGALTNS